MCADSARDPARMLERLEHELERIGLLLQHDAQLPSATAIVAGAPVPGSWWAHPLAHPIYDVLQLFKERAGRLHTKIVDGKVTYVHERLWPAFLVIAQTPDKRLRKLSTTAQAIRERLASEATLRADELARSGLAATKEITRAVRELELRLLVHTDDVHTDSGAHAKVLTTWTAWAREHAVELDAMPIEKARALMEQAITRLCEGTSRKPKLPW